MASTRDEFATPKTPAPKETPPAGPDWEKKVGKPSARVPERRKTASPGPTTVGAAAAAELLPDGDELVSPGVTPADAGGYAVPAGQAAALVHTPEQAADASPAELPYVPAGQGAQTAAPASE